MDWIYEPMRIAAKQSRFPNEDIHDIFQRFTVDFHCNVEQLNHIFKGTDPEDPDAYTGEFKEELHSQVLDEYIDNAHKKGIKIICYFLLHQVFEMDKQKHPDWIQVHKDGTPCRIYGNDYGGCPSSSWGTEYTLERIAELCRHNVDGIFLDGPNFFSRCCYCDSCKAGFRKRYGKELEDATLKEFVEFRVNVITEFVAAIRRTINEINPNIILYLNNSALISDVPLGCNTRELAPYVDIIGAEGGFVPADRDTSIYFCSAFAKDIEDKAEGKPTVIFAKAERSPSPLIMHTAGETKRVFAQTVANGASIWYGIHGAIDNVDKEGGIAAKEFFAFLEQNQRFYRKTKNVADVAIMWSMPTADYYGSSVLARDFTGSGSASEAVARADHYNEYMGFVELLEHNHILFDSIDEVSIQTRANKYGCIILPACANLTPGNKKALLEYVRNGGTVIASFDTGILEGDNPAPDYGFMNELFGIQYQQIVEHPNCLDYLQLSEDAFPGVENPVRVPPLSIDAEATTADVLASFYGRIYGDFKELKELTTPAITKNSYGKGQAFLLMGNFGEQYGQLQYRQVRQVFSRMVDESVKCRVQTNAPACVEITLREQEDTYILHLINHTLDGFRPLETNIPIHDLSFTLRLDVPVSGAQALKGENIRFAATPEGAHLELDKLTDYTVIVLYK